MIIIINDQHIYLFIYLVLAIKPFFLTTMAKVTLEQHHTLWNNGVCDAKTLHKLTSIPRSTIYDYVKKLKNGNTLNPYLVLVDQKLSPKKHHFLVVLFQQINLN